MADGVLVVVPPVKEAGAHVAAETVVGGLPLLRRIVLAARHAGYERVLVRQEIPACSDVLAGTGAAVLSARDGVPATSGRRMVLVPANVVPQPAWLRLLREMPMEPDRLYVDPSMTVVVDAADPGPVMAAALHGESAEAVVTELRAALPETALDVRGVGRVVVGDSSDVRAAERWLLRGLIKQNEGFMSRHFERRLSLALTRWLVTTSVTPNVLTLVSLTVGLMGATFFLSSAPRWQLTGALLFLAHSILDGCDGEVARLKFLQSRAGALLDYWGDNVVHVAVFGCIAVGWSLRIGALWPLALGVVAIAALLGAATLMFRTIADDRSIAAGGSVVDRMADAAAHRDFIYLIVLASAFGKAHWCLIAATVGTPGFLALVLWRNRRHGRLS